MSTLQFEGFCFNYATCSYRKPMREASILLNAATQAAAVFVGSGYRYGFSEIEDFTVEIVREEIFGATIELDLLQKLWEHMAAKLIKRGVTTHMQGSVGTMADYHAKLGARIFVWITYLGKPLRPNHGRELPQDKKDLELSMETIRQRTQTYMESCKWDAKHNLPLYVDNCPNLRPDCSEPRPLCSLDGCSPSVATGAFGGNDGQCKGDVFKGCPCFATGNTQGHCGVQSGPCNENGCNGQLTTDGTARCTGAFSGCKCIWH
ncbi:uncharacterized protein K460DRAFT_403088 [Cucurbitaria berberidis CBS 394.84]|uniref:Uncharacterized protein n=1 Tax=Cucurbitaria berberidis CBS 394.84 TaxID=1168544 RepID=A0A9P4LAV7_9PLEO|nr:uncharacterized protein K460DRAFT_403088 [Cucurbitaria berberidis CBS 394.84]KAF1847762.1 hypothetical protein K460DRAFT_403088 [Cucurbitaria berberidis CBS 394.84]